MFNLLHLLFISLTPYVASLIGHYEGDRIVTIVFSANLGLASLSLNMLGFYLRGKKEWRTDETEGTWWTAYAGPVQALVSILLSLVRPDVAILIWLLLPMKEILRGSGRHDGSLELCWTSRRGQSR